MFKVYFFSDYDNISDELLSDVIESLPKNIKETATRYKKKEDIRNSAISYFMLKNALKKDFGLSKFSFIHSVNGKPYLKDNDYVFFNISHCEKGCVCAVSDREIGIDIQEIREFSERLAEKVCSEKELQKLEKSKNKSRTFTKIWVKKESLIKMTGDGFSYGLKKADTTSKDFVIIEKNGCFIAVCEKNKSTL